MNGSNKSVKRGNLFIPIETKVRELHGKILLGVLAARAGFRVVLGEQRGVRELLPFQLPGIYLDKSVAQSKTKWFKRYKLLGNKVIAWDEEGLIFHDGTYVEKRFSKEAFEQIERFYVWGNGHQKEIMGSHKDVGDKLVQVGNPRFDMLRPELRSFYSDSVKEIRSRFGRFVLINTNFGHVNHFAGPGYKEKIRKAGRGPEMVAFIKEWRQYQERIFQEFIKAVKSLSSHFSSRNFVVRPHPSEDHEYWKEITSDLDNVHVVHEGNVIEWILASDCVVHNDCTTAVEAFFLDVPVVAFRSEVSEKFETFLPNALSISAFTVENLLECIGSVTNKLDSQKNGQISEDSQRNKDEKSVIARQYVFEADNCYSSDLVIQDLLENQQSIMVESLIWSTLKSIVPRCYYIALFFLKKVKNSFSNDKYLSHKFDELSLEEVINIQSSLITALDINDKIRVQQIGKSCFVIDALH